MQYTEGPWWVAPSDDGSADGREVFDGYGHTATVYGESEQAEANARLIAAAPELLAELKEALGVMGDWGDDGDPAWAIRARAAIAKAEGRSE